jgi:hypothetical protein
MRVTSVALVMFAGLANAKECVVPEVDDRRISGIYAYARCMNEKLEAVEKANAELRKDIERIEASLTRLPGELSNENGRVTRIGGESLTQATFALAVRRREGPASLAIDQDALETLCVGGCTMTLVLEGEALRTGDPASVAAVSTCLLRYSGQTGAWSQAGGCGEPVAGVDGDGKAQGKPGGEIIATLGETCMLADSEAGREVGQADGLLAGDRSAGLFLIAVPASFQGTEAKFRCEMKITR